MNVLGFDTSNYTTSIAFYNGAEGKNCSRLLDVKQGELGLRQSDALFSHVSRLPELAQALGVTGPIDAIGVSTRPRAVEGSYMPCFLAGVCQAKVMGSLLGVPVFEFSHQQGHIAAACWGAERMDLMEKPHLAWHLSGGTTELLLVTPEGAYVHAEKIGGTTDLSAGQLIDRTGKLLGLPFPSGKHLDSLSRESEGKEFFPVRTKDQCFSFSGIQNQVEAYYGKTGDRAATARFCLLSILYGVENATRQALAQYPGLEVVFAGGVASNSLLRSRLSESVFCPPQYATDNAMGIALLTWRSLNHENHCSISNQ